MLERPVDLEGWGVDFVGSPFLSIVGGDSAGDKMRQTKEMTMPAKFESIIASAVLVCAVVPLLGCRGTGLFPPAGPINRQQATAIVHDPFPQEDIAPSDNSVRPPSYQRPLPEAVRNRFVADAMPWLGR